MAPWIPIMVALFFFSSRFLRPTSGLDFLFNSFNSSADLSLVGDARIDPSSAVIRFTNDSKPDSSFGRAFYSSRVRMSAGPNSTAFTSFSSSFVFSVLPDIPSSPGFGVAFVLSNTTSPPGAIAGQYFGLFSNSTHRQPAPLLAVEFDTGQNPEFDDPDGNHVGIDLNYIESSFTQRAGYYQPNGEFVTVEMRSGRNVRAWIEFDGSKLQINVTIAPADMALRPSRPLISYTDPEMANYLSPEMWVGFSASKVTWVEVQRVLAWSFSDTSSPARELNTTNLPIFRPQSSTSTSSHPSVALIAGAACGASAVAILCSAGIYYYFWISRGRKKKMAEELEEWELEYWPRRFTYDDLYDATNGFARENVLGFGGFGKVYKGVLRRPNSDVAAEEGGEDGEVAVKCVSYDSKQGVREFMAEISSMGRLQHKSLVQMRGWCRRGHDLMLVYDFMPNGSLNRWIVPASNSSSSSSSSSSGPKKDTQKPAEEKNNPALLGWEGRKQVLIDVAEGLLYLHEGWEKVVLHRDVKPSNILMDKTMRGKLGDFGLAKLHGHGEAPTNTRVVGTLGYLAPELTTLGAPTKASDVYSYGMVVLEACCGRRVIEPAEDVEDDDFVLVDWVRGLYREGRLKEAVDGRMGVENKVDEVELALKLGLACSHPDPEHRPTMKEVVEVLVGST